MCQQEQIKYFFFQAEDGIRDIGVTGVQTCALPIFARPARPPTGCTTSRTFRRSTSTTSTRRGSGGTSNGSAGECRQYAPRSEERRGGKGGRSRGSADH